VRSPPPRWIGRLWALQVPQDFRAHQQRVRDLQVSAAAHGQDHRTVGSIGCPRGRALPVQGLGRGQRGHHVHKVLAGGRLPVALRGQVDQLFGAGKPASLCCDQGQVSERVRSAEEVAAAAQS
jgi:hypothetical protein